MEMTARYQIYVEDKQDRDENLRPRFKLVQTTSDRRVAINSARRYFNERIRSKVFDTQDNRYIASGLPALGWFKVWDTEWTIALG